MAHDRQTDLVNTMLQKKLIALDSELWAAIDSVRGHQSRAAFIQCQLIKTAAVKKGIKLAGVKIPDRPADGRGLWRRNPSGNN